ncbi:MAG: hypothetical protein WEB06_03960 [Actinomycetota bacterium]
MLLRASDGNELCTLAMADAQSRTTFDVEVTPDGQTVYFSDAGLGACGGIYSVAINGGSIREVIRGGYGPVISPDGRRLAYDASHSCGDRRHRMVVRNLETGAEREWIGTWEGGYGSPRWAPDPRFLVVARAGSDSARHFLLDTRKGGPLDGMDWPTVDEDDDPSGIELSYPGLTLTSPTVRPGRRTVAFGVAYSDVDGSESYPIIVYDPAADTWRVLIEGDAFPVDYDSSGTSLLFWRRSGSGLKLFRYTDGRSFFLGKGFHDASW